MVLLVGFVALAAKLGLETILGAFLAGAVVGLVDRDITSHPHFRTKLEALGYGFLIPVFFVASGLRLDLDGLIAEPSALARVPVLALGAPRRPRRAGPAAGPAARRALGRRPPGCCRRRRCRSWSPRARSASPPGRMSSTTAAALVCAGLLSVIAYPAIALALLKDAGAATPPPSSAARPDHALDDLDVVGRDGDVRVVQALTGAQVEAVLVHRRGHERHVPVDADDPRASVACRSNGSWLASA